jgi:hypothetical protein
MKKKSIYNMQSKFRSDSVYSQGRQFVVLYKYRLTTRMHKSKLPGNDNIYCIYFSGVLLNFRLCIYFPSILYRKLFSYTDELRHRHIIIASSCHTRKYFHHCQCKYNQNKHRRQSSLNNNKISEIWNCHGMYEDGCLLGCCIMSSGRNCFKLCPTYC